MVGMGGVFGGLRLAGSLDNFEETVGRSGGGLLEENEDGVDGRDFE